MEESSLKVKILTASGDPPVARKCLFHSIPQFDYLKSTIYNLFEIDPQNSVDLFDVKINIGTEIGFPTFKTIDQSIWALVRNDLISHKKPAEMKCTLFEQKTIQRSYSDNNMGSDDKKDYIDQPSPIDNNNVGMQRRNSKRLKKKNQGQRDSNRFSFLNVLTAAKEPPRNFERPVSQPLPPPSQYLSPSQTSSQNHLLQPPPQPQQQPQQQPQSQPQQSLQPKSLNNSRSSHLLPPQSQPQQHPSPQSQVDSNYLLHPNDNNSINNEKYLGPDVTQQPLTPGPQLNRKASQLPWYLQVETKMQTKKELKEMMDAFLNKFQDTMNSFDQDSHLSALANVAKSQSNTLLHEAVCDGCNNRIKGVRLKCTTCKDYDLCIGCYSLGEHEHDVFHRISDPSKPLPAVPKGTDTSGTPLLGSKTPNYSKNIHHSADCDYCKSNIVGIRHKCTICPDFDVCDKCFNRVQDEHPFHSFVDLTEPKLLKIPEELSVQHPGVICDGCQNQVVGYRFKCSHSDCFDVDLCGNCESSPIPKHDKSHIMLKIRQPIVEAQALNQAFAGGYNQESIPYLEQAQLRHLEHGNKSATNLTTISERSIETTKLSNDIHGTPEFDVPPLHESVNVNMEIANYHKQNNINQRSKFVEDLNSNEDKEKDTVLRMAPGTQFSHIFEFNQSSVINSSNLSRLSPKSNLGNSLTISQPNHHLIRVDGFRAPEMPGIHTETWSYFDNNIEKTFKLILFVEDLNASGETLPSSALMIPQKAQSSTGTNASNFKEIETDFESSVDEHEFDLAKRHA